MSALRANAPAWADRVFARYGDRINSLAPKRTWQPTELERELGCGAMGCVFRTHDPNVVFKLTDDGFEVAFVNEVRAFPRQKGVVRFYRVEEIGEGYYGIWRQAIDGTLGKLNQKDDLDQLLMARDHQATELRDDLRGISKATFVSAQLCRDHARRQMDADDIMLFYGYCGLAVPVEDETTVPMQLAMHLWAIEVFDDALAHWPRVEPVGRALIYFRRRNVIVHDVHLDNIGVTPKGLAIFDATAFRLDD